MASRLQLQSKFEELLGSKNVYYDPPENLRMTYPAIRYVCSKIESKTANNAAYIISNCYEVTVIASDPDNPVIKKLLALPMCKHNRHYKEDGLNHDTFTLYY